MYRIAKGRTRRQTNRNKAHQEATKEIVVPKKRGKRSGLRGKLSEGLCENNIFISWKWMSSQERNSSFYR